MESAFGSIEQSGYIDQSVFIVESRLPTDGSRATSVNMAPGVPRTPICAPGGSAGGCCANVINDEASIPGGGTFYDDASTPGGGGTPTHDAASTPGSIDGETHLTSGGMPICTDLILTMD